MRIPQQLVQMGIGAGLGLTLFAAGGVVIGLLGGLGRSVDDNSHRENPYGMGFFEQAAVNQENEPRKEWLRLRLAMEDSLAPGEFQFGANKEMRQGVELGQGLELRQGQRGRVWVTAQRRKGVSAPGAETNHQVSPKMEAQLQQAYDEVEIQIKALDSSRQVVTETSPTKWTWEIEPVLAGEYTLPLRVYAIITTDDKEEKRQAYTLDLPLHVRLVPLRVFKRFVTTNWQLLLSSPFILGALAWLLKLLRRETKRPNPIGFRIADGTDEIGRA